MNTDDMARFPHALLALLALLIVSTDAIGRRMEEDHEHGEGEEEIHIEITLDGASTADFEQSDISAIQTLFYDAVAEDVEDADEVSVEVANSGSNVLLEVHIMTAHAEEVETELEALIGTAADAQTFLRAAVADATVTVAPTIEHMEDGHEDEDPCFPSTAHVTLADGTAARIDALRAGDSILAVRPDGSLGTDVISRFSLANSKARATFIALTTEDGATLELTERHHLPVGPERALKQARDVEVGDTLWRAAGADLVPQRVAKVDVTVGTGLHNPLLVHGSQPIVDGVATSFNTARIVAFDAYAVPVAEAACAATGTCTGLRRAVAAVECAAKHVLSEQPVCKTFHYIDGPVVAAPALVDALAGLAVCALTAALGASVARARK